MAAELSSRQIKSDENSGLITRDFLGGGGCSFIESKELDLDLNVPSGFEKRLDLKSGNLYLQRHIPANTQSHHHRSFPNQLNSNYASVCTLDKVKVALERAETPSQCSSSSSSSRKRWMKETEEEGEYDESTQNGGLLVCAACPGCFLYVLISRTDPKCPNCKSLVQLPHHLTVKKPKLDLNL